MKAIIIMLMLLWSGSVWGQHVVVNDSVFNLNQLSAFRLKNYKGQMVSLQLTETPLKLFIFLSPDCPLCKNYSLVLNQLQNDYQSEVTIYGIIPGKTYSSKTVDQFRKEYKITFPLFVDVQKKLTGYIKAQVTPEAILLNGSGDVIYRGAIDDWIVDLGKKKRNATEEYLKQAIFQYIHQQPVAIKRISPKGCLINEF